MDELEDELDLRWHRGIEPDVYYRCPSTESLDGALRNELEKSSSSLIPLEIVTEFIFGQASTITIPVNRQPDLDSLFEPADFPQSITVDHALCRGIEGKERLKLQRAIARSFIDAIEELDGFKYSERKVDNKDGSPGARFRYLCMHSSSQESRKRAAAKRKERVTGDNETRKRRKSNPAPARPTYDCGGVIHVNFSTTKDAVHVVYKHNPIHRDVENGHASADSELPALATGDGNAAHDSANGTTDGKRKRKRTKKDEVETDSQSHDPELDMVTSPEASKTSTKKKRKKSGVSPETSRSPTKKPKKAKQPQSSSISRKKAQIREPTLTPPPPPIKGKCLRCREKGIKCNEAKPTCNQCRRGLWTCQYEIPGPKKRSRNGCMNCRSRKRKCTEERPSCAYCLKVDDDCVSEVYQGCKACTLTGVRKRVWAAIDESQLIREWCNGPQSPTICPKGSSIKGSPMQRDGFDERIYLAGINERFAPCVFSGCQL